VITSRHIVWQLVGRCTARVRRPKPCHRQADAQPDEHAATTSSVAISRCSHSGTCRQVRTLRSKHVWHHSHMTHGQKNTIRPTKSLHQSCSRSSRVLDFDRASSSHPSDLRSLSISFVRTGNLGSTRGPSKAVCLYFGAAWEVSEPPRDRNHFATITQYLTAAHVHVWPETPLTGSTAGMQWLTSSLGTEAAYKSSDSDRYGCPLLSTHLKLSRLTSEPYGVLRMSIDSFRVSLSCATQPPLVPG
jgi:hypothetical protein